MRVAVVTDYLPGYHATWSGAELIAVTLSEMLTDAGCKVFFLTTPFDYAKEADLNIYPVNTPMKRLGALSRNFPLDIPAVSHLTGLLRSIDPDVVHINAKYLFLPAVAACLRLGIPSVFTVPDYFMFCPTGFIRKPDGTECLGYHGRDCHGCLPALGEGNLKRLSGLMPDFMAKEVLGLRAKVFDFFLRRVSAYVVLSETSRERLQRYGIPKEKIRLVYHYKPVTPIETSEPIESPSAVFVGWLSEENGTDILLRAFAKTARGVNGARLYLAGTGKSGFVKELKKSAEALNISRIVVFLGKKDNREALSIISKSDVVVVPHQWPKEFGPIVLIEALSLGKPVVTSKTGATWEFVADGINGFLIKDYKNPDAFADKIRLLLSNPSLAARMGAAGRGSVSFLFNDGPTREIMSLYGGLIR